MELYSKFIFSWNLCVCACVGICVWFTSQDWYLAEYVLGKAGLVRFTAMTMSLGNTKFLMLTKGSWRVFTFWYKEKGHNHGFKHANMCPCPASHIITPPLPDVHPEHHTTVKLATFHIFHAVLWPMTAHFLFSLMEMNFPSFSVNTLYSILKT